MQGANFTLKDEIREYWTRRAETFDLSPGHGMKTAGERDAWAALLRAHMGADARRVLELAFGTGEVTRVLLGMGCEVTGLDLTEAMLLRARAKHAGAPGLRLFLGDAEETREPDNHYDAVVSRHLVWTLVDPAAAFRDWYRVLRPGGRVVIADGDYVRLSRTGRLRLMLSDWLAARQGATGPAVDMAAHEAIQRQVFFRDGLRPEPLRRMLEEAGFTDFRLERPRGPHAAQRRGAPLRQKLRVGIWNSFVLSCARPAGGG
ncbi:class I SAM-dependent methyltransferase [Roseomonas marmotae]|uniref:Class I SAM-dependent methyltransferase n=1 Tax=Roseomonas marmotae TaxID=2768161 RepID=A0ABS3KER4_9PROT|nr:class I SAM-dependent methyltransferase [Roseomonas marmotae]MBO1075497.1 class I SAM-dependent methyltransferase [Roseomonas marmotae]QTI81441.1 class I SAM-dependent methyltransferase [Roseomonas marmotae]